MQATGWKEIIIAQISPEGLQSKIPTNESEKN